MSIARKNRRPQLNVQTLEDRSVPATFSYLAGTLTVTAADNDFIQVSPSNNAPVGYLHVNSPGGIFDSITQAQPVTNLVVKMGGNNINTLFLDNGTFLAGSVSVLGAKQNTNVTSLANIGKNFTFQAASGAASDIVTLSGLGSVGGNASIKLGNGNNTANLTGGTISGNVNISSGTGNDNVFLTADSSAVIGGSVSMTLGAGTNQVHSAGDGLFKVGKDLTYTGGSGKDDFDMTKATTTTLDVGGKLKITLGAAALSQNDLDLGGMDVGGSVTVTGGKDPDTVNMTNYASVGGSMTFTLGDSENAVNLDIVSTGGSLIYNGGLDTDNINWNAFQVGKDLKVNAKGSRTLADQNLRFGTNSVIPNSVNGSMTITGGEVNDFVRVNRVTIGGALKIATGGRSDELSIDDTSVAGATLIDLGAGGDSLQVDNQNSDGAGNLNENTTFGGSFTVKGGEGNDFIILSSQGGNLIKFGGKVILQGGTGNDTFENTILNEFFAPGSTEDFEADNGVAIP